MAVRCIVWFPAFVDVLNASWVAQSSSNDVPEEFSIKYGPVSRPDEVFKQLGEMKRYKYPENSQILPARETKRAQSCQMKTPILRRFQRKDGN